MIRSITRVRTPCSYMRVATSERVRGRVDLDLGTVGERTNGASQSRGRESLPAESCKHMLIARTGSLLVLAQNLVEERMQRDEPELAALPGQPDLGVVEVDPGPSEPGCFAQSQPGKCE